MAFQKKMRGQNLAYSATDEKDFAQVDLTPISPAKSAGQRSSNSSDYARFRNDRILSSQDKRLETRRDAVPMPKSTRKSIFAVRRVQVVIRGLQLVGSGGLLAVLILLSNIPAVQSYIVRAPVRSICHFADIPADPTILDMRRCSQRFLCHLPPFEIRKAKHSRIICSISPFRNHHRCLPHSFLCLHSYAGTC
jgi:hypothetical protein